MNEHYRLTKKFVLTFSLCVGLFILVLYIGSSIFYRPFLIIPRGAEVEIHVISTPACGGELRGHITELIDTKEVFNILSGYYVRRTIHNPFARRGYIWDILVVIDEDPLLIALSENLNVMFRSGNDRIVYEILDWESLLHELQMMKHRVLASN